MQITGKELFVKALAAEGVDTVFAYPGGMITDVIDELYRQDDIRLVLPRHEQALVHEAEGYARATGRCGVCLVTSGPGATNTITGIVDARYDSIPLVIFTGQVPQPLIGNDAFQEVDIVGMTRNVVKYGVTVRDRKDLGRIIRMAFHIASTGRPGPVLIDLPKDIQLAIGPDEYPSEVAIRGYRVNDSVHLGQLKKAFGLLKNAKRPLILAGGGVVISGAQKELAAFAETMKVPVVTTIMGKGAMPADSPYYVGNSGMHGRYAANTAVAQCDVLFSIGTRFNDRITGDLNEFAPGAKIVHIDMDTASISRNVAVDVPVVCDAKLALTHLIEWAVPLHTGDWMEKIAVWEAEHPLEMTEDGLTPQKIMEGINDVFTEGVVTTDVGQHQMWATQYIRLNGEKKMITSGGLGTMGFGFPAAIGAKIGCPDADVICVTGDGGMQMNMQEMATSVLEGAPVTVCILNNANLGMVRQMQQMFYGKRYEITSLNRRFIPDRDLSDAQRGALDASGPNGAYEEGGLYEPDFVKWAESYHVAGLRVTTEEEIRPALSQALVNQRKGLTTVIEFVIDADLLVLPMVKGGNPMSEMILAERRGGK